MHTTQWYLVALTFFKKVITVIVVTYACDFGFLDRF